MNSDSRVQKRFIWCQIWELSGLDAVVHQEWRKQFMSSSSFYDLVNEVNNNCCWSQMISFMNEKIKEKEFW